MRKFKRFAAVTLSSALALSMVACGNNNGATTYTDAVDSKDDDDADADEQKETTTADDSGVVIDDDGNVVIDDDSDVDLVEYFKVQIPEDVIPEETVTLTVYSQRCNEPGEQQGWWADLMLELFNVKIVNVKEGEGTFATRMEAGDLGDIIVFGSMGSAYEQAYEGGLLYDLEEDDLLSEYGSFIEKYCQSALEYNKEQSGGTLYGVADTQCFGESHDAFFYTSSIRWDVYEEIGCPEFDTLEDLVPILKAMVEACPTNDVGGQTYAVSLHKSWDGNMVMYPKALAALYGYDEWGFGLYDCKTDTWESCLDTDGMYIRCLKFYNTLYREGLLDPDSMSQEYNDAAEDFQNGTVMWDIFNYMTDLYNTDEHLAEGKAMLSCQGGDFKNLVYGISPQGGTCNWCIGANTEYPELCMAILNWMYSPEGTMIMNYGPQGLTWDYTEDGEPYLTDLGLECQLDRDTEIEYNGNKAGFDAGKFQANNITWSTSSLNPATGSYTYNYKYWPSYLESDLSEIEQSWSEHIGGYTSVDDYLESEGYMTLCVKSTHNSISSTPEEIEVIWNQCADEIKQDSWKAIYAADDDEFNSIIQNMIDKCNAYGFEQCADFCEEEAQIRKEATEEARASLEVEE